jgi:hypothetical protein
LLRDDVRDGYITAAALTRDYGLTPEAAATLLVEARDG